jgi:hypothetical protein
MREASPGNLLALEPLLRRLRRKLNCALALEAALPWAISLTGVVAGAQVAVKLIWPAAGLWPLAGLAALPVVALAAAWQCHRRGRFFKHAELVEVADHLYRDDGALASAYENPHFGTLDGAVVLAALQGRLPRLRWGWHLRRVAPVAAFLLLAALTPARQAAAIADAEAVATALTQPLAEKLAANDELLPESAQAELQQALEALRQSDQGVSKEQWEAIEDMEQRVDQAIAQGQSNAQGMAQSLSKLSALMNAQGNIQGQDQQRAEALAKEMENALQDAKRTPGAKTGKQLAGALKQMRAGKSGADLKKQLDDLKRQLEKQGECEGCKNGNCSKHGKQGRPGKGGLDRGRGDAELTFEDEKKLDGTFQNKELSNQYLAPEDLVEMGITPLKPDTTAGTFAPGAARQFETQAGARASQTRITPSQREVIAQYFKER